MGEARIAYLQSLEQNKYAIKHTATIYELIDSVKRSPEKIGPYQNISVFEALNRIGSDLVLLAGATKLFAGEIPTIKPEKIHLKMGTTHGFDFEVHVKDSKPIKGEAFNAALTFCGQKMRQAIHKLLKEEAEEAIIFINESARPVIENYRNTQEGNSKIKIHRVYCGNLN